jgi:predicted amidohydrolase
MRLTLVQFTPQFPGRDRNWTRILEWAERVESDVIVFPELSTCGYSYRDAEEIRPYTDAHDALGPLIEIARRRDRLVIGGFAERDGDRLFNSAYVASPEGFHLYRKIHLWDREKAIFEPGNHPLQVEFHGHRIGVQICYDLQFPELASYLSHAGVELLVVPTSWAQDPVPPSGGLQPYTYLAIATSLAHGIFTAVANRTGVERGASFPGESSVSDPWGRSQRLRSEEGTLDVDLEFDQVGAAKRPNDLNDLDRDARLQLVLPKGDRAPNEPRSPTR